MMNHYLPTEQDPTLTEPIDLEFGRTESKEAMDMFDTVIHELPMELRRSFNYRDDTRPRTGESGYVFKEKFTDEHEAKDRKHVYHHSIAMFNYIRSLSAAEVPSCVQDFNEAAHSIYFSLARSMRAKFEEHSEEAPWLVGVHFPKDWSELQHMLRFLAYELGSAQGHYDKGVYTVAVDSDAPGLQTGIGPDDLHAIDQSGFNPRGFFGYGWHQMHEMNGTYTDKKAAWHGVDGAKVDSLEEVQHEKGLIKIVRRALIGFSNPHTLYLPSTNEQTHTPIPWDLTTESATRSDGRSFFPS